MNLKHIKHPIFAVLVAGLSLSVFAAPQDDGYEENDAWLTAYDHTSGDNSTILDAVSMDEDWYKIEAKAGTTDCKLIFGFWILMMIWSFIWWMTQVLF